MKRRHMLTTIAGSAFIELPAVAAEPANSFLELRVWRMHNSEEDQQKRVADYLEKGYGPALDRAGAKLVGAFANLIGPDGPNYTTVAQFRSFASMGDALNVIRDDAAHKRELQRLGAGPGLPFVRVESSVLRCFDAMPAVVLEAASAKSTPRVFELRTYESQSFATLPRKVDMFNHGEMQIFQRLQMRPVFFGETVIGANQPNLTYMLSYDDLAARERLWREFSADPEWKKLSGPPEDEGSANRVEYQQRALAALAIFRFALAAQGFALS